MNNRIVNRRNFTRMWFLGLSLLLAACGDGHGNSAPVANAGPDQTSNVQVGDAVLLDGSASSDPDGNPLTYSWSFETVPVNSTAAFSDPTATTPSFIADRPGMYTARLTVNDGIVNSAPDSVSVTVVVPPPKVTITAPENLSVVTATALTVKGTIDDPNATLTVNGEPITNNNGSYTTDVTLQEGSNTVTVVGKNGTGEGSASVVVMVNTSDNPALSITSPTSNFITGKGFAMGVAFPASTQVTVQGVIKVNTSALLPDNNKPTVTVNGVPADVSLNLFFSNCGLFNPFQCWKFTATIPLAQGNDTISAVGTDVQNRSTTVSIGGTVDYCRIGEYDSKHSTPGYFDSGVLALAGENRAVQSNRCHEIDGCSAPNVTQQCADDPMQCPQGIQGTVLGAPEFVVHIVGGLLGEAEYLLVAAAVPAQFNQAPTALGHGAPPPDGKGNPPDEYFVHGDQSAYDLPCNHHDPCYQTCVDVSDLNPNDPNYDDEREQRWENAWHACNDRQHREMLDICATAYPATCPYTGLNAIKCLKYFDEKLVCTIFTDVYYLGVQSHYAPGSPKETLLNSQPSGLTRFKQRQMDYCAQ